ncbi:hypothetical protein, partial [Thiospirillum jenense]|uniref:hypothetical protein n=1 Tax=Thiospirillum jenense TaxID=1653858 RepID=UPI001EE9F241
STVAKMINACFIDNAPLCLAIHFQPNSIDCTFQTTDFSTQPLPTIPHQQFNRSMNMREI